MNLPMSVIDVLLALAFLADAAIRYTHYLREDQWTGGFLEWLLRGSKPKE
jgi:hypothetical protein